MLSRVVHLICLLLAFGLHQATAQSYTGPPDPRVKVALTLNVPTNGVSTTPDGRLFLVLARVDGSEGPQVVEYHRSDGSMTPYPNLEWNSYKGGKNPAKHFLGINSQRIGPDGHLWIVDKGAVGFGNPVNLPYGPKLVVVDLETNRVIKTYPMGKVCNSDSLLDDVRFHTSTRKAYLTDAGSPSLIVLDLDTGDAVRVLDNELSTREYMPVSAEGHLLRMMGEPVYFYADHEEVSPDGKYFYYQPASGGMSRIETQYLDEAFNNASFNHNSIVKQYVEPYAHTPSTGGTAIDADGNIYDSDTDSQRIVKIAPNGTMTTLVQDPRLLWVDALWVDTQGLLWMPATQLNRGTPFHNGVNRIVKPLHVYTIDIGTGPSPIDHA